LETTAKSPEEIMDFFLSPPPGYEGKEVSRSMIPAVYGDIVQGGMGTGQVVGLIRDIPTCQELIERIIKEAEGILDQLSEARRKS
jgi:NAD(P)H-dependent flavin oxidoreductase YrpB (nitropropane dioxygenase family)